MYVDLFAGTGLVKIKNSDYYIPSSCMCAASLDFDYYVFVEKDKANAKILKTRLSKKLDEKKFDVIIGDCNDKIDKVITRINEKFNRAPILLTFVDPEALQIKFSTLKKLNEAFPMCDFMINVNHSAVNRVAGKVKRKNSNVNGSLENYYDKPIEEILYDLKEKTIEPQKLYEKLIVDSLDKPFGDIIKIPNTRNKIAYYILGYTRKTGGGSTYARGFGTLKERIGKSNKKIVKTLSDIIFKKQTTL